MKHEAECERGISSEELSGILTGSTSGRAGKKQN